MFAYCNFSETSEICLKFNQPNFLSVEERDGLLLVKQISNC